MPKRGDNVDEFGEKCVALDYRHGNAELAWDLAKCFVARMTAAIEVTTARVDYYLGRLRNHQESLPAADNFAKVFIADAALHADLEQCGESGRLDAARVAAAEAAVELLQACQLQWRPPSQRALLATLFPTSGESPASRGVPWLRRGAALWLAPPFALNAAEWNEKFILEKENVADDGETNVQQGPQPASEDSDLEEGHASDSAFERRRGARGPYLPPGASSRLLGLQPAGPLLSSSRSLEAAATSKAAQPASGPRGRRLVDDLGAGGAPRGPQVNYFDMPVIWDEKRRQSSSSGLLLIQLRRLHEHVLTSLAQHVERLAKVTSASENRARRRPRDNRLEAQDAERQLRAEVLAAANEARAELTLFRQHLCARAEDAAAYRGLMERIARSSWWRDGGGTVAAARQQRQRPLGQRLASWWRGVAGPLGEPGDSPEDVTVEQIMPPE